MRKASFLNALGTVAYISIIATVMQNGEALFGAKDNAASPVLFLMLFTLSAFTVSALVLGKPLMMYMDGKKNDAVTMFLQTIGWLAGFTVVVMVVVASL